MQTMEEAFAYWRREQAAGPDTEEFPAITDEFLHQYDRRAEFERKIDEFVAWRWEAHERLRLDLALLVSTAVGEWAARHTGQTSADQ